MKRLGGADARKLPRSQHQESSMKNQETELASRNSALRADERQLCEVWTRVMGYHRPVASFNEGKKGEHEERVFFQEGRLGG